MEWIFDKFKKILSDPRIIFLYLFIFLPTNWIPDRIYLKILYRLQTGKKLNLENPVGFCEKLQWLKLNDRRQIYSVMADKYEVKRYVAELIGEKYIIPFYKVYDSVKEIDLTELPDQFVLKCTHDSGSVIICKDKNSFDFDNAKKILNRSLKKNHYWFGREWPYRYIKPRIIAEQYLFNITENGANDYKVLCFNGVPKLVNLYQNRFGKNPSQDFYDTNWRKLNIQQIDCGSSDKEMSKPDCLDEMLALSQKLARGIPHIRVDWYVVNCQIKFGELTLYDGSGFALFLPDEQEKLLGSWIDLKMSE